MATAMTKDPVAVTIASKAYLSLARVTAQSFKQHHPDIPFVLLLTDEVDGYFDPSLEPFTLLSIHDLELEHFERFRFQYSQQEFSYAVTPHVIEHLLKSGHDGVLFLKQETLVLGNLDSFFEDLQTHSLMLTPHLLAPPANHNQVRRELDVLRAGIFNGGVIFAGNSPYSLQFLDWWKARTFTDCICLVEEGIHYEQRWLDFAPALVPDTKIIRDPGVNVGHWNLLERDIEIRNENVFAKGSSCRIFRFSGYDPSRPDRITKYYSDRKITETPEISKIFNLYHSMLIENGYMETCRWPYAYGHYDNGVDVTQKHRGIYRKLGDKVIKYGDPLATDHSGSFWKWIKGDT